MSLRRGALVFATVAGLAVGVARASAEQPDATPPPAQTAPAAQPAPAPAPQPVNKVQQGIDLQKSCIEVVKTMQKDCTAKGRELFEAGLDKMDKAGPLGESNTGQAIALADGAHRDFDKGAKECTEGTDARKHMGSCNAWAIEHSRVLNRYLIKIQELGRQPGAR